MMVATNLIEMRSDLFKLSHICQRPIPLRATGIHYWFQCLQWLVPYIVMAYIVMAYIVIAYTHYWSQCLQ